MRRVLFAALVFSICAARSTLAARFATEVVVLSGDPAPDGNGYFGRFTVPTLNNSGQVAFLGNLLDTSLIPGDERGVYRADGHGIVQIARKLQAAPDGNGYINGLSGWPVLNDAGEVAFFAFFSGTSGDSGFLIGDGNKLAHIVREDEIVPDADSRYSHLDRNLSLNDSGQTTFSSSLRGQHGRGIFRGTGSEVMQIALDGQLAPDGSNPFFSFDSPTINNQGEVAFIGNLDDGIPIDDKGVFRSNANTMTQIARIGQMTPSGDGRFEEFQGPSLNDAGQTAFLANIADDSCRFCYVEGIFRADGGVLTRIARSGESVPDGNGEFSYFEFPSLNNAGQVAFFAKLAETSGGTDDEGIFRGDGNTLTQIVRKGQPVPDGNGNFSDFWIADWPTINEAGDVAFLAKLTNTTGGTTDDLGIYAFIELIGVVEVARSGDEFLGSTITGLGLNGSGNIVVDGSSALNDRRQIAYSFALADGRQGIAIATLIPEPSSRALLCLVCLASLWSRRDAKSRR